MQVYTWDKEGFEGAYWKYYYKLRGCGASRARWCKCNDTYITYSRNFFETNQMFTMRATSIIEKLALPVGSKILVVGAALGYLNEELNKLGMVSYAIDNSQYIHSIKHKEKATVEIHNIDVTAPSFKSQLASKVGVDTFDCVITEDVMPSYSDWTAIVANCNAVVPAQNHVVHIVETDVVAPLVAKTLDQWRVLNSTHLWLNGVGEA